MGQEIRQAIRSLASSRWSTILAIITLAIGIGASAAIYSVVYAVIFRPLPFDDPDRLVDIRGYPKDRPEGRTPLAWHTGKDLAAESKTLEVIGLWRPASVNLVQGSVAKRVEAIEMTPEVMIAMRTPPLLGRTFARGDGEPGRTNVAVLSYRLWQNSFGGAMNIVGSKIRLNSEPVDVIGVMPEEFRFDVTSNRVEIWVPIRVADEEKLSRDNRSFLAIGRVRAAYDAANADAELAAIFAKLEKQFPEANQGFGMRAIPLRDDAVRFVRAPMRMLLGAVAVLMLVACLNVASLLLARTAARQQEIAIRVALGATRALLARQFVLEGLVLAATGAAIGGVLAFAILPALVALVEGLPRASEIRLDGPVLAAAAGAALLTGILFSLAPLWQASRADVRELLLEGSRGTAGQRTRKALRVLVAVEIALAFVLVLAAGVLGRSLLHLRSIDPGFRADGVLSASLTLPEAKYPGDSERRIFFERVLEASRSLPGVESAGAINVLPMTFRFWNGALTLPGDTRPHEQAELVEYRVVSRDYFRTMGIRLISGSDFSSLNTKDRPLPAMVNETCMRAVFGGRDPVGREAIWVFTDRVKIVGVVTDSRNAGLERRPRPEIYFPFEEIPLERMTVVARTSGDPASLVEPLRRRIAEIDAEVPLFGIRPMTEVIGVTLTGTRHQTLLTSILAVLALILGAVGGYGVMSYAVAERTREFGIRMALGAPQSSIVKLVLKEVSLVAAAGIVIGIAGAWAFSGLLRTLVSGVAALDPATGIAAAVVLGGSAVLAGFAPARRASRVDPMVAIRHEGGVRSVVLPPAQVDEDAAGAGDEPDLLAELPAAVRHAESAAEIFEWVTVNAREALGVESVTLFVAGRTGALSANGISLPVNSFLARRLAGLRHPFEISAGELDAWERAVGDARAQEIAALREVNAHYAARIHHKEETTGILCAGPSLTGKRFGAAEKRLMMSLAGQLALVIENTQLASRIAEQERLRREIALATEVQRRLFPSESPHLDGVEMYGICLPARGVGGDYFDFIELPGGRVGIALADVAGKGIAAALLMSIVQASVRSVASGGEVALPALMQRVNQLLHRSTGPASYATFFYSEFDPATRRLTYVNAGHNPPMLIHSSPNGPPRLLQTGGPVIGLIDRARFESETVELESGDILLAYSDGASEAQNSAEDEFGEDRLLAALSSRRTLGAAAIRDGLVEDLRAFMGDAPLYDDLTLVVLRVS